MPGVFKEIRCSEGSLATQSFSSFVVVLVLDFLGRGKRTDSQQRSKIENEEEDDWGGNL